MSSLNKIILVGTVGFDPDIKVTTNDNTVAKFTLSVARPGSGENPSTQKDLIPIVAWNQSAEYIQNNISKGDIVYVSGRISERTYEDTEGNRKWITEVESRDVKKISPGGQATPSESNSTSESKYDFTGSTFPESTTTETTSNIETKSDFKPVSEENFEFNDPFDKSEEKQSSEENDTSEVPF